MAKHISEVRTEDVVTDLLSIQGWDASRPPHGCVARQNEYKGFLELADIFTGKSKSGKGDAYPDFLVIDKASHRPLMVIEAKADEHDFAQAVEEARGVYAEACRVAGHPVIAVGIAGQNRTKICVGVSKYYQGQWREVVYEGKPISWIPTYEDVLALLSSLDR